MLVNYGVKMLDLHFPNSGVDFLASVLGRCPQEKLNSQAGMKMYDGHLHRGLTFRQVRVLTTFFCDKLEDTETIIPALKGLVSLTTLPAFTSNEVLTVVNA